ncbi:MAG: hypothetical protein IJH18_01140 [Bacilli bacterium]|nr:hypothetical protein [Bacilli bacterium]MBQ3468653.1 hypothetical protein [Bacilli bacterium]
MYQNQVFRNSNGDRFFWAPFVVGGLAGTALGYGIANNNQSHFYGNYNQGCCPMYYNPPYPVYTNNYYYRKKR